MNKLLLALVISALVLVSGCLSEPETNPAGLVVLNDDSTLEQAVNTTVASVIGNLSCSFNENGIKMTKTQFGTLVHKTWNIPVVITNNSVKTAENVVVTLSPEGQEDYSTVYELGNIPAKDSVETSLEYSVRDVAWINPNTSLTADNVEVSENCAVKISYDA